jgi:hypothetical protein
VLEFDCYFFSEILITKHHGLGNIGNMLEIVWHNMDNFRSSSVISLKCIRHAKASCKTGMRG